MNGGQRLLQYSLGPVMETSDRPPLPPLPAHLVCEEEEEVAVLAEAAPPRVPLRQLHLLLPHFVCAVEGNQGLLDRGPVQRTRDHVVADPLPLPRALQRHVLVQPKQVVRPLGELREAASGWGMRVR